MNNLLRVLLFLPLVAGAQTPSAVVNIDTNTEAACRAHMKSLAGAVQAYRLLNDKPPEQLAELYLSGLIDSFGDFSCPASGSSVLAAGDIDGKSDYTLTPLGEDKNMIIREKSPRHRAGQLLVVLTNGAFAFVPAPGASAPGTNTAAAPTTPVQPPGGGGAVTGTNLPGTPAAGATNDPASWPVAPPLPGTDAPVGNAAEPREFSAAHEHYVAARYVEALPLYNAAVGAAPGHRPSRFERAVVRLWLRDLPGALHDTRLLVQTSPADLESRRLRAALELVAGDARVGWSEAEAALKMAPNDVWVNVLHGQAALWNRNNDAAQKSFARAMQLDPRIPQICYHQGNQFLSAGVPAMAYLQFTTVLWLDPNFRSANYGVGFASAALGLKERAIQAFEAYLQHDPSSEFAAKVRQELNRLSR